MATTTESAVSIPLNAADRIFELGIWSQFKVMLEHTKRSTPGLRSISVSLVDRAGRSDPTILIIANIDEFDPGIPGMADESTEWRWDRWAAETFPSDVLRHFCMMAIPDGEAASDGR